MAQYLKPYTELGYVEDSAEIEALKFNNARHVVLGCMLGDFNEVGDYIVSSEIVNELISMEKYIVQTIDNIELCKSALKLDKQISFMVTFEGNKASLTLIEKINYEANFALNSGVYSNINEYVLDFVETSGEINRNVIYDKWNIKPYGGNVVDIFNCDDSVLEKYFGIVNRFKYLLNANKILLEKEEDLEEIESCYINEIFTILSHYPKLKEQVENSIKESLKENKNSVSVKKAYFAKTLNEILENSIIKNIDSLNEQQKLEFEKEKRNIIVDLNIKRTDALEINQEKDETSNKETSPKIIRFKPDGNYENQTISELGINLVNQDKKVFKRINGSETSDDNSKVYDLIRRTAMAIGEKKGNNVEFDDEISQSSKGEKNKLIASLIGLGVAEEINAKKKTVEKQQEKEEVKEAKSPSEAKSKPKAKQETKKDNAKKAGGGGKKPQKKDKGGKSKDKPKDKPEEKKEELPFRRHKELDSEEKDNKRNENDSSAKGNHNKQEKKQRTQVSILSKEELMDILGENAIAKEAKRTDVNLIKVINNNNAKENLNKASNKSPNTNLNKANVNILDGEGLTQ